MLGLPKRRGRPPKNQNQNQSQSQSQNNDQNENTGFSATEPTESAPKKPRGKTGASKAQLDRIRVMLEGMLNGAAFIAGTQNQVDALIIKQGSPALVDSIIAVCETDKWLRDTLYSMTQTSGYIGIAMASAAIVVPILANHGLIPPLFAPAPKNETVMGNGVNGSFHSEN